MPQRGWSSLVSQVTPAAYTVVFLSDGEGPAGVSRGGLPATEGLVLQVTPAAHTGVCLSNGKGMLASISSRAAVSHGGNNATEGTGSMQAPRFGRVAS